MRDWEKLAGWTVGVWAVLTAIPFAVVVTVWSWVTLWNVLKDVLELMH